MPHLDQSGPRTGEAFEAQNVMREDFHSVMSEEPCNIVKQIDDFRGATDNSSLKSFPSAENLIDTDTKPADQSEDNASSDRRSRNRDVSISTGDARATTGDVEVSGDKVKVETGDAKASTGDVEVSGAKVKVETGDAKASTGDVEVSGGKVKVETGDAKASTGDVEVLSRNRYPERGSRNDKVSVSTGGANAEAGDSTATVEVGDNSNNAYANPTINVNIDISDIADIDNNIDFDPSNNNQLEVSDQFSSSDAGDSILDNPESDALAATDRGLTINIINVTPNQLPGVFGDALNGPASHVHSCNSLMRNLQGLFRPTDARYAIPQAHSPIDFISNLSNVLNGNRSNSLQLPSPTDFIGNLQRSFAPSGMESFLPMPPRPDSFIRDLQDIMGYTGDNQSVFPRLPRPDQFLRGLGRSLGFDSAPFGDSQAFRTLGPLHAMNETSDFIPRFNGPTSLLDRLPINPIENLPFGNFRNPFDNLPNPLSSDGSFNLPFRGDNFLPSIGNGSLDLAGMLPGSGSIPSPLDFLGGKPPHIDIAKQGAQFGLEASAIPLDIADGAIDLHTDIAKAPLKLAEDIVGADSPLAAPIQIADKAIDIHEDVAKAPLKLAKKAKNFFKKLF